MQTNQTWANRVADYVDDLEIVATTVQQLIANSRIQTKAAMASEVAETGLELLEAVGRLENMVERREQLMSDAQAPASGTTLIEKLRRAGEIDLADRSQSVAHTITAAHQAAVSLFVCQYHLASHSQEILRLLAGMDTPRTYRRSSDGEERERGGGRLFNDAA
ncbi:hypothetical protein [Novipirellula rosea]|uniref:FlgN protein n=1 Tax=Novipirellula rosea TaxID=1031540 RepID=A0ABP8NBX2_9BACT|tara:strand:+ start:2285 stop:2773 length:489 start_codon:yes stop_codon:yes gene_type:complete